MATGLYYPHHQMHHNVQYYDFPPRSSHIHACKVPWIDIRPRCTCPNARITAFTARHAARNENIAAALVGWPQLTFGVWQLRIALSQSFIVILIILRINRFAFSDCLAAIALRCTWSRSVFSTDFLFLLQLFLQRLNFY